MSAVLIVEDERSMRLVLSTFLKRKGIQVSEARGVSEARKKIQQERYDVVITDLKMDDGGGIEVLRAVQRHTPDTPVIILTGYATIVSAIEMMKLALLITSRNPSSRTNCCVPSTKPWSATGAAGQNSPCQRRSSSGRTPPFLRYGASSHGWHRPIPLS